LSDPTPFCKTAQARKAFTAWCTRLQDLGVELAEADFYVIATVASREAALDDPGRAWAHA
jgi:hypothetical protein